MKKNFWKNKKILITGSSGFIGKNLVSYLKNKDILKSNLLTPSSKNLDLTNSLKVKNYFKKHKPNIVFHLAAKQGGINVNLKYPASFFYENNLLNHNVIHNSYIYGVKKLISAAAGSCYPELSKNPLVEDDIHNGLPNDTHLGYSISKRNLIIQSHLYKKQYNLNSIVLLPANIYGPHANFNPVSASVLPALTYKFYQSKINKVRKIDVWGNKNTSREFMYVDDFIKILIESAERINDIGPFNVGTGEDTKISELVEILKKITDYQGKIIWKKNMPVGVKKRTFSLKKFRDSYNYSNFTSLEDGLKKLFIWLNKK